MRPDQIVQPTSHQGAMAGPFRIASNPSCDSRVGGTAREYRVSNTTVKRFAFRSALPAAMVAILFCAMRIAEQEDRRWIAQRAGVSQRTTTRESFEESVSWRFPFAHSERIQDLIGFQWPAFAVAGLAAPVPEMLHQRKGPDPLTRTSYVVLTLAVAAYWFVIGTWLDRRLIQHRHPLYSKVVRVLLKILTVPTLRSSSCSLARIPSQAGRKARRARTALRHGWHYCS